MSGWDDRGCATARLLAIAVIALSVLTLSIMNWEGSDAASNEFNEGNFYYTVNGGAGEPSVTINGFVDTPESINLVIPDTVEHDGVTYKVTIIRNSAFQNKTEIKTLKIGNNVQEIGARAFGNCNNISGNIVLPDSLKIIGNGAFEYCSELTGKLVIPDTVTQLQANAFANCAKLTGVTFGFRITSIDKFAFMGCTGLKDTLHIPDGITFIGEKAFYGCFNIAAVTIGSDVKVIEESAFAGCNKLKSMLYLPAGEVALGRLCFALYNEPGQCLLGTKAAMFSATCMNDKTSFTQDGAIMVVAKPSKIQAGKVTGFGVFTAGASVTLTASENLGYEFTKWSNNSTEKTITFNVEKEENLTAVFTPIEYSITYTLMEGAANENPASYNIETPTFTLKDPTKRGYEFKGWTWEGQTENVMVVTIEQGSVGNKAFTGEMEIIVYNIEYELNGGVVEEVNPKTYTVEDTFTLNNPTKRGYTFLGWSLGEDGEVKTEMVVTDSIEDLKFFAHWEIIVYTITYVGVDGMDLGNPVEYTVETETFTLNNPEKKGYNFMGWIKDNETSPKMVMEVEKGTIEDITFTAKWEIIHYSITYIGMEGAENPNPLTYTVEDEIVFENPTKRGYEFMGWTYPGQDTNTFDVVIPKGTIDNRIYTAHWKIIVYTISYELDGGAAEGNPATYTVEDAIVFKDAAKNGYMFAGWFLDAEFTKKAPGIAKGSIGNITVYAKFLEIYKVTYVLDGGINGNNPVEFTVESAFDFQAASKHGYTFKGWFADKAMTKEIKGIAKGTTGNVTVYAKFIYGMEITWKWMDQDGNEVSEITYVALGEMPVRDSPAEYVKDGQKYVFSVWSPDLKEVDGAAEYTALYILEGSAKKGGSPLAAGVAVAISTAVIAGAYVVFVRRP